MEMYASELRVSRVDDSGGANSEDIGQRLLGAPNASVLVPGRRSRRALKEESIPEILATAPHSTGDDSTSLMFG